MSTIFQLVAHGRVSGVPLLLHSKKVFRDRESAEFYREEFRAALEVLTVEGEIEVVELEYDFSTDL